MTTKIPVWRTVQFKYSCVLFFGTIFLVAISLGVTADRHRAGVDLYNDRKIERQTSFDVIAKLNSQALKGLTVENTYWDEMVSFISKPTTDFEETNLRPQLDTYNASGIWTYNKNYKLVSNTNNLSGKNASLNLQLSPTEIKSMFSKNYLAHYYKMTDIGLLEVYGATVHDSTDGPHVTPNQGYFYIARIIDDEYAKHLSGDTHDTVRIIDVKKNPTEESNPNPESGNISFYRDLKDESGVTIARIHVSYHASAVALFFTSLKKVVWVSVSAYLLLAIAIYTALHIIIIGPLSTIYRALSTNKTAYLDALAAKGTEFGRIAQLIEASTKQKNEILEASEAAKQAQTSLERRTDELERINGLMVNRELQMIQIKKENKELKAKLEDSAS